MKKVDVYLNRRAMGNSRKRIYSIRGRSSRVVEAQSSVVLLEDVELVVRPGGRAETLQRVKDNKKVQKTVHAFLRGSLLRRGRYAKAAGKEFGLVLGCDGCSAVGYDPAKTADWVRLEDYKMPDDVSGCEKVFHAKYALLHQDGILVMK